MGWDLSNPGMEPESLASPELAGRFFTTELPGKLEIRGSLTYISLPGKHLGIFAFSSQFGALCVEKS